MGQLISELAQTVERLVNGLNSVNCGLLGIVLTILCLFCGLQMAVCWHF